MASVDLATGLRVLRGPDWSWGEEDDGEGHVGTVVEFRDEKRAVVVWDCGRRMTCRIGCDGKYDLRVLDNATVGTRHDNFICDACGERGIQGMRWRCQECDNFDLCPLCYVTGQHELTHPFFRITGPQSKPVPVDKRNRSMKVRALGIFPGATVQRGPDWNAGNSDGGEGQIGEVVEMVTTGLNSTRSEVKVKWPSGVLGTYRLGRKGKVDLEYVEESPGIEYYPTHLPVLDFDTVRAEMPVYTLVDDAEIRVGDRVCVELDADTLKTIHKERGGWSAGMTQCIGRVGIVNCITMSGEAEVVYGDEQTWRLFPGALRKVPTFSVGQIVRVMDDEAKVSSLQVGHGEWNSDMRVCLGRTGRVTKIDSDGDLAVCFGKRTWMFSPAVLIPAPGYDVQELESEADTDRSSTEGRHFSSLFEHLGTDENHLRALAGLALLEALRERLSSASNDISFAGLVKAITEGGLKEVKTIIERNSDLLNQSHKGLTALHIASHEGSMDIVSYLVSKGVNLNKQDDDGDTAVMIAVGRNMAPVAEFLVNSGCDVNLANRKNQTPVHYAAYQGMDAVLRKMMQKNGDINKQDESGDTPLHDAIEKNRMGCVEVLLSSPKLNLRLENKRGLNPLHYAALKGCSRACELILGQHKSMVDQSKDDGFTALHIAAFNDHADVVLILLKGGASINIKTKRGQTPLHLSCEEAYYNCSTKLIEKNADILAKDEAGNTPLHAAMAGGTSSAFLRLLIGQRHGGNTEMRVRLSCYLLQHGANIAAKNNQGQTPLDAASDRELANAVRRFSATVTPTVALPPLTSAPTPPPVKNPVSVCSKCRVERASVIFLPCAHKDVCRRCCALVSACTVCSLKVTAKVDERGRRVAKDCTIQ